MSEKICCFTGHRNVDDSHVVKLYELVDNEIEKLIGEGYTVFRVGGALGFDTIAASRVILKKKKYSFIRAEFCLPCKDQSAMWKEKDKFFYNFFLKYADEIRYAREKYTSDCMFARNRMLVDGSSCCVAYCDPKASKGGSKYTIGYAKSKGIECRNLYPEVERFQ